jgi:hypothetical protein
MAMRGVVKLALASGLLLGAVRPAPADDPRAVLERALKAHGGAEALTRSQVLARQLTGALVVMGKELPFAAEQIQHLPGQVRLSTEMVVNGQKLLTLRILNGDKGWQSSGGAVQEMTKEELHELREEAYSLWLTTLVPLQDKAFTLAATADVQVRGQPAVGIRVTRKGHGEVRLYFDKASGLLVKLERRTKEGGLDVDKEYTFFGHKSTDGVVLPTKYTEVVNGKKLLEVSSITYRLLSRVEEGTFAKP